MAELTIYSMVVCPYAQRTRMLLDAKNIPYKVTELDISKPRPQWFLKINPSGQVPVIEHGQRILNESSIINEYIEEVFPDPPAMPQDAYRRGLTRILIEYGNKTFIPLSYRLLMNQDPRKAQGIVDGALASWRWVNDFLVKNNPDGVYLWEDFGMADLSFAPFFQRYKLSEYYRGFSLPETEDFARVRRWRDALLAHPLTQSTGLSDEDYIKLYEDYSLGVSNGGIPAGRSRSSFDLTVPLSARPLPQGHAAANLEAPA